MEQIRLSEIIAALSHALDLTEGQPPGHAQRSCALALRIAAEVGLGRADRSALFYAMLLKDAGCSSSAARMSALFGGDDLELKRLGKTVDWTRRGEAIRFTAAHAGRGEPPIARARHVLRTLSSLAQEGEHMIETRCERGARIVSMLDFPSAAADAVYSVDEHWDGRGKPLGRSGEEIPLLGRIACLAQTVEVFMARDGLAGARAMVMHRQGRWFDPRLADAFLAIGDDDPLWDDLRRDDGVGLTQDDQPLLPGDQLLDRVAEAFAQVIDAKSPFTARHSERVAEYAVAIGAARGLGGAHLRELRRAGLLHDIGKLGVSNSILDKPGRLTGDEYAAVREHPRHTEEILLRVPAFAALAPAAAAHHERIDGRGYHRGLAGDAIPPDARILAVADVYDALTADRPYRSAMTPDAALDVMRADVSSAFCPDAFAALESCLSNGQLLAA